MWLFAGRRVVFRCNFPNYSNYSFQIMSVAGEEGSKEITESTANIKTAGKVFYNPVQEFNRDLSIAVLNVFAQLYAEEKRVSTKIRDKSPVNLTQNKSPFTPGVKYDDGLNILEALSATGLRSIRYAKEVAGVNSILANDISKNAVEDIKGNIASNNVEHLVKASLNDATMVMYEHKRDQFDVIDLDPYGCPSIFLDGAVQAIKDGGLLLITATDMAVLAGNSPETCYSKYGAVSLRIKSCHEMALRILLQCIESHANRYGRYIVPLLSISADFYIRVFVRVFTGPHKCKHTTSKLSMVHHCNSCDSFSLQPLGLALQNDKNQVKFTLPKSPYAPQECPHCKHSIHMGGPIWSASIHDKVFTSWVLQQVPQSLGTLKRIQGILNVIMEELDDVPLYYTLGKLSSTLHCVTPSMLAMRSALLNANYKVSYTHSNKTSIKTDAPASVVWDIMRNWIQSNPVSEKWKAEGSVSGNILSAPIEKQYSFDLHPEANPVSRKLGFLRYQANPFPFWGPGSRSQVMTNIQNSKKVRNQGKRKRTVDDCDRESLDNDTIVEHK